MSESSATVLIVDDHRLTAELTGMALEASGFTVLIEEGGPAALAALAGDGSIRAVVSDMNMPGMDGLALLDALRQKGFAQPFILLTGQDETAQLARHPGLDAVMTKDETVEEALPLLLADLLGRTAPAPAARPANRPAALPGLDLEVSLRSLNNNWETMKMLLGAFREEYLTAAADYRGFRDAGDTGRCLASLHSLKGAAGMLGATRLPSAIANLEKAIAARDDLACWDPFAAALNELLDGIQGL
jgi:CheY-like chemotaxis protein